MKKLSSVKLSPSKQAKEGKGEDIKGLPLLQLQQPSQSPPSKSVESFASYFPRVLKQGHMGLSLSQEAVNVMKSFVMGIFQCIAKESGHLARNKCHTITSRDQCVLAAAWGDGQARCVRGCQCGHQRHHQQIG